VKTHVSLLPSLPHFASFAHDSRLGGIRINNTTITEEELRGEMEILRQLRPTVPIWFDIKSRQPRVVAAERIEEGDDWYWRITLNHKVSANVEAHPEVILKGGRDREGHLLGLEEDGRVMLVSSTAFIIHPGESLHLPGDPTFDVLGEMITDIEKRKIAIAREAGISRFYLSFVWDAEDARQVRRLTGDDVEIRLKIEDPKGLDFVQNRFQKDPRDTLVLARGDLCVAVMGIKDLLDAHRLIIEKDPQACAASRILLSAGDGVDRVTITDMIELEWLRGLGYRSVMLCDTLCHTFFGIESALRTMEEFTASQTN